MGKVLGIVDLLGLNREFDLARAIKLVRHQDARYDMQELVRSGWFETYQSYQRRPVFHNADFLAVCLGEAGTTAKFWGVYSVMGNRPAEDVPLPAQCPYPEMRDNSRFWYDLCRVPGFEALENRVIIEWGKATRSWCQKLSNKPVIEIQRQGQVLPPFRDYLEFTLTHDELVGICMNPETHREWRARLSAVAGVYLIVATTTGDQYVGSAYGEEGIWGRWTQYAKNGYGGNVLLQQLIRDNPAYPRAFRYSVLQILPKTMARAEVLDRERVYKEKLGKRAICLNAN